MDSLKFFNPYAEIRQTANRLPHWQQKGAVYFLTFRLADSVPTSLRLQWESERAAWLRVNPEPRTAKAELEYHRRFSGAVERWLDAGWGCCLLREPSHRAIVAEALRFFDGERLALLSFVIMPNHVHTVFVQHPDWSLEKLLRSWKSFTSKQINELRKGTGSIWQRDYFDRLVRDEEHLWNCVRYIRRNPSKARLREREFTIYESELVSRID